MLDLDLTGRTAIVTGASLGIGAAAVQALADQGATVAFCARGSDAVEALAAYAPPSGSGGVRGYVADMANASGVESFLDAAEAECGPADILVNNVGASPSRNFLYMSDEDWEALFQVNLMSAVRCSRRCVPAMRKKKWGRIVMVATPGAMYPEAPLIDYAATKAGMIATGKALAAKYGPDGVLVNSILPGLIHTSMWNRAADEIAEASGGTRESVMAKNSEAVPIGRYGTAEEVAAVIAFLCSPAAGYVTGTAIYVDGGMNRHI